MIYYLSLGANLGEREKTLHQAVQRIEQQVGPVRRCSSFFYSTPWGFTSVNDFCNLCCAVETDKSPIDVLHLTQAIERALGRTKKSPITNHQSPITNHQSPITNHQSPITNHQSPITNYSDRCIDIDLIRVFEDDQTELFMDTPELTIPHRFWLEREFVKTPLAEIMPK